jgi:short-subunit dehydrogenase
LLVARREAELAKIVAETRGGPGEGDFLAGDITSPSVRRAAIARAVEHFGGLDLLVNNAGVSAIGRFADADEERLRRIMEVNFFAPAALTREALPALERGRRPMVVNVGSILAFRAIPHASEYCASKFALRGLGEALRAELAPRGIDLLNAHPGTTDTDFFDHALERGAYPWAQPRGAAPEAVARQIVAAIARGKHEALFGLSARLLRWANSLAPGLVDWVLARYG